jgi:hemolysin activation/secretion protein
MVKDEQPMHLSLDYNNFGSKAVSRDRFGIGFEMGNLAEDGHIISLRAIYGSPVRNLAYYRGEYMAPLGYDGRKGHFNYARGDFDVGGEFERLNIEIKTESVGIAVSYPFFKATRKELLGKVGFEANNFRQTVFGNRSVSDRIRVLRGEADYKRFAQDTRDFLSVTLTQGLGSLFGGTENGSALTSRPGADDLFTKGAIDWVRVRLIPQPYFIPHPYALIIAGSAQIGSDNLVVSEQFSVGGADSVRGYSLGEFMGDDGYRFSTEIRISPFPDPEKIQGALFLDHAGSFKKEESPAGEKTNHFLTGIGLGVRYNFPGAITVRKPNLETETPGYLIDYRFQVRADLGFPVGQRSVSQGRGPIFYLQAIGRF